MGYDIYGYAQIKKDYGWKYIPVYKKESSGYNLVSISAYAEPAKYIWQKGSYVTEAEKEEFYNIAFQDDDPYDPDDRYFNVKAISLAALKYYEMTFNPNGHNDYEDAGDEDYIKPGMRSIINEIEVIAQIADEYYLTLDDVRFIFFESY